MHPSYVACVFAVCAGVFVQAQQRPPLTLSQLTWYDRAGKSIGTIGPLADHGNIELSPDGMQIASAVSDKTIGTRDIWTYRVGGGAPTRLTSTPSDENWMVWSVDGTRAIVNAFSESMLGLFEMPTRADAMRRQLTTDDTARWPVSLSPDGRFLLCVTNSPRTGNDIWVLPMNGSDPAYPFQRTPPAENWATFSPDGRFVAFSSAESGAPEVFVTPFPGPGPKWRVSEDIGSQTRWRQQNELVYVDGLRQLVAVTLRVTPTLVEATRATPLFQITYPYGAYHAFDVTRDGQRFLVNAVVVSSREPAAIADARATAGRPGL